MSTEPIQMTRKGYEKLKTDLDYLKTVRREQISEYMGSAIADGDLRESAAYDEARMQQSENEARILEMEDRLSRAVIVETEDQGDRVGLGARVSVEDGRGKTHHFEIVGTYEVDVLGGKISDQSPIGQALSGRSKGDVVQVPLPKGAQQFKILDVKYE
ncbi:transcription elongation factor GreA [Deinococcus pimensis]|uniref:transcription elongation factor GreA n=1 Tax=Deinococcus pimensis TaxID=309888 RepID=UPI0004897F9A|nr:transcription elongation factor GreA [Deinococcus pimensis]